MAGSDWVMGHQRGCKDQMAPHKSPRVTEFGPSVWHNGAVAHGRRLSYVQCPQASHLPLPCAPSLCLIPVPQPCAPALCPSHVPHPATGLCGRGGGGGGAQHRTHHVFVGRWPRTPTPQRTPRPQRIAGVRSTGMLRPSPHTVWP